MGGSFQGWGALNESMANETGIMQALKRVAASALQSRATGEAEAGR